MIEIFGIIKQKIDIEKIDSLLYLIHIEKIGYIICKNDTKNELSAQELPQNIKNKNWSLQKASEHSLIIQKVHYQTDIIPLSFLTIFENENNIKKSILQNQKKYNQIFEKIKNQTEYIIRIWGDVTNIQKEIIKTFDSIQKLIKDIEISTAGKQFVLKKQVEKEINQKYPIFIEKKLDVFFQNIEKNKIIFKILNFNEEKKDNQELMSRIVCLVPKNNNFLFDFLAQQDFFNFECSTALPIFNFLQST